VRRAIRSVVAVLVLAFAPVTNATTLSDSHEGDAERIAARIAALEASGMVDDSTLGAARALLALADTRRASVEERIGEAAVASERIAALEREIGQIERERSASDGSGTAPSGETRSAIALAADRDALDAEIERARQNLATLDERGAIILETLSARQAARLRAAPSVDEPLLFAEDDERPAGQEAALDVLADARQHERVEAEAALRQELGTVRPRQRVAAAELRLLEARRSAITLRLDRRVRVDDTERLREAEALVERLTDALDDGTDRSDETEDALRRSLEDAGEAVRLVRDDIALAAEETTVERWRRALLDADISARAALVGDRVGGAQGTVIERVVREMPDVDTLDAALVRTALAAERLQRRLVVWEDTLRREEAIDGEGSPVVSLRQLVDIARALDERLERRTLTLRDLRERSATLGTRLERRLLWVRRVEPLGSSLLDDTVAGVRWLGDAAGWAEVSGAFVDGLRERSLLAAFGLLGALALRVVRHRLLAVQTRLAARVGHLGRDGYPVTPEALLLVPLLALPLPLVVATLAGTLAAGSAADTFAQAIAIACLAASAVLFALDLFRWLSRPDGVFVAHFGWHEDAAAALHRHLRRLVRVQVPMTLLLTSTLVSDRADIRHGLGLLAFVVASIALGAFVWRLCRPHTGVLAIARPARRPSLASRLLAVVLVAVPIGIGLLPLAGYFDAAIALQGQAFRSGLILLSGAVLYGLLLRLYGVSLRRYSLRWARERRAASLRSRDASLTGEALPSASTGDQLAPEPLAGQARNALLALVIASVGGALWWLWSPLLPALGVADEIVLWERSRLVDGATVRAPVTLWSLILSLGFITGGVLAARNLRGLLQVGVLQRLEIDAGTRYAIVTIAGYIALGVGVVGSLAQLGIDWSKLQWIVAALGVGLGFGLQEIVANFVSGLIILFERPVRVGDTVTIGALSGTVSDIRIRATTITDFENREVLLPNKSIITENVTNWTLHDAITRLLLTIGVAYGSDVAAVRALLEEIVHTHPDVLSTPTPTVFFVGHGASSLDFELRVFVATPAQRLPVTHDLNAAINRRLAQADIAIPFPQTDVNLHMTDALSREEASWRT